MQDKTYKTVTSSDGLDASDAAYWRFLEGRWYKGYFESVFMTGREKLIFAEIPQTSVEDTQGKHGWFSSFKCEAAAWKWSPVGWMQTCPVWIQNAPGSIIMSGSAGQRHETVIINLDLHLLSQLKYPVLIVQLVTANAAIMGSLGKLAIAIETIDAAHNFGRYDIF